MERFDIAIIGTGPAGISAAITAKIRNKNILLIGSKNLSEKINKAHLIQNYPGLPSISGADLSKAFAAQLAELNIEITDERVGGVYAMGDFFGIQLADRIVEADTVILAAGVTLSKPLDGEEKFLGKGVSYCATCDAQLYRGKSVIVIGYTREAESEANFLYEIAAEVTYFPIYKGEPNLPHGVKIINEIPTAIFGGESAAGVVTSGGKYTADGIFILRDSISPKHLVPGLNIENNHVAVNLNMETNLPGLFACGDITGRPYQYIKSAGQGNVAALSAVAYIEQKKKNKSE